MLKKFLVLFLLLSSFSFSRFVNECRVLSRDLYDYNFRCRSLESGKIFTFHMPGGVNGYAWTEYHKIGRVYKIFFHEEYGSYILENSTFLY